MRWVEASIAWATAQEGGRSRPPEGPRYSTVARFDRIADRWPHEAWSVVIEPSSPGASLAGRVRLRLLVEDGPDVDLLAPGSGFHLLEGDNLVARGTVTRDWLE